jgi:hypothetical protein
MQTDRGLVEQQAAVRIQSMVRGVLTRRRMKKVVIDFFKRKMIIRELLET